MAMTEDELKSILDAEIRQSLGYLSSELSADRVDAWNGYLGEKYGNEIEGRSQVVSTDIQDTVEWIMPQVMRIFTAGDSAVECVPNGPEDEDSAKQATDYANYVWDRDNEGFKNFYFWFKDALIAKLGVVKIYWENYEDWKRETYSDIDDDTFALIAADKNLEIVAHTEKQAMTAVSADNETGEASDPQEDVQSKSPTLHDVTVKFKKDYGKICVDPVPPDEFLYSRDARNVTEARFIGHRCRKTISDLIEQYPGKRSEIENLDADEPGGYRTDESQARSTVGEDDGRVLSSIINHAMREVWVTEGYIRVDYDGDGIAEMRKVTVAGAGNFVLDNDEWEGPRPFAVISPILMPHRLTGISVADTIKDLQLIKTAILRQYLDALYIANNPRQEVVEDLIVDPAEVLTSKPGGIVRVKGSGATQAIRPIEVPFIGQAGLAGLQYIDQLRENRTGVSPRTQGLGADALHDTKGGQELLFSAAQSRIELIARVFAETGVKDAFKLILFNASRYQEEARTVRLRNQWVPVDPREWADEYDMTVNVGLGHNNNEKQIAFMQLVVSLQAQALQLQGGGNGPVVTLDNVYNGLTALAKAGGAKSPDLFFTDPKTLPPQPPKPDPKMIEVQGKMQLEHAKAQADVQMTKAKGQTDMAIEQQRMSNELTLKREQMAAEMQLKREQMVMEATLKREQMQLEAMTRTRIAEQQGISGVRPGGEVG